MRKAKQRLVRRPEDLLGAVRKALATVSGDEVGSIVKALSGPVAEAGDKKPTPAIEGAQDDQAFAVAHGVDNYDALTKKAQALAYLPIFKAVDGVIAKQGLAAMNVPGNLKEHLQKALAAVHGREVFDARYEQACKLLKKVCDLMDDIEKTAEGAQGGSGAMVMAKANDRGMPPVSQRTGVFRTEAERQAYNVARGLKPRPRMKPDTYPTVPRYGEPGSPGFPRQR